MMLAKTRLAAAVVLAAGLAALGAAPCPAAAQPATEVKSADATAIGRNAQHLHCQAQLHKLKQTPGLADGQSDQAFMKTCLADVDPVAVLPGSGAVMNAPAGSTGVCKDGTYSTALHKHGACSAHGGLTRWFGA